MVTVLKTVVGASRPWVRIPPPPLVPSECNESRGLSRVNAVNRGAYFERSKSKDLSPSERSESRGLLSKSINVEMEQEWFFYIVKCRDNSYYSGITNNIEHRIKEHNKGAGAKYTLSRRPVILVYSEKQANVSEARKRESQIKSWPRVKKERLIVGFPQLRSE